jgi:two-component system cell cycle response regulator
MTRDRVANPLDDTTRMAPAQEAGPPDAQPAAACLVVLSGSNVGEMYRLEKDQVVVGRGDKVDLRLVDDGISREHVRFSKEEGRIILEDLGSTNGTYCNGQRVTRQPLSEGDKILIGSTTILKFSYQDKLDEMFQRQMSESALRDGLTRAFNKRYFTDRIESEFQYAIRHRTPLSLIFLDIDHFKKINDQHGHQAGDHVLAQLSTLVMSMLGEEETFARYGGEEFAIVARGAELAAATELSERLRAAVEAHPFKFASTTLPVTISVGVARAPGPGMAASGDLVARADEAMYAAKRSGRNRVCSAEGGEEADGGAQRQAQVEDSPQSKDPQRKE